MGLKKWKLRKEKRKKKEENSTELQKPNIEAEVYDDNKNVTEKKRTRKLKSLIGFLSANEIDNYKRGRKKGNKQNPKESIEQVKREE